MIKNIPKTTVKSLNIALVITLLLLQGCEQPQVPMPLCEGRVDTREAVETNGFSFNLQNTRNQTLSLIDSTNVESLVMDYTIVDPNNVERRGAPAVTENTIFYSTPQAVFAIDRESGCQYWSYYHKVPLDKIRSAAVLLVDEPILQKRLIMVGTFLGRFLALDAADGALVWQQDLEYSTALNMVTGGMQYHNGVVYVPVATKEVITAAAQPLCCFSHGVLAALNSHDGSVKWEYHTTANRPILFDSKYIGPNGISIWSTPLIDEARTQVVVGTAQNLTRPYTDNANALVALDMATGAERWIYQVTSNDSYNASCSLEDPIFKNCDTGDHLDFDVLTPVLAQLPEGGVTLIGADKSGRVMSLDPATGKLRWQTRIGAGGELGGIHWGVAIDENKVYAAITDVSAAKSSVLDSFAPLDFLSGYLEVPVIPVPGAAPGIYALNLIDGSVQWSIQDQHTVDGAPVNSLYSAALTVSNDLLFAGSLNGVVKAFRTSNGEELWHFDTAIETESVHGYAGNGGTIDSVGPVIAKNQLYINSGYNTFGGTNEYQAGPGNTTFLFSITQ